MSRLWRDQLLISLAPRELSWVRLRGLLRPAASARRTVAVAPDYGARAWDGALAALRAEAAQWQKDNLAVRMVLSNHFVRYTLVPSSKGVNGGEEELALARFHFAKVHGDASRDWSIRLSPAPAGATRLACAVDNALIEGLQQSFPRAQRAQLTSIQPLFMSVFNSAGTRAPGAGAWFVTAEADRACVALHAGKSWHAVQNVKGDFADSQAWASLVERVRWSVPLDKVPDTIWVHAASSPSSRTVGAWKVMGLPTRWPAGLTVGRDSAYAAALSAA